ncbi:hypothetical protein QYF36_021421 [Acer negundo]|nr:hypothetical protein QYF36_021421 [Acer negundo]
MQRAAAHHQRLRRVILRRFVIPIPLKFLIRELFEVAEDEFGLPRTHCLVIPGGFPVSKLIIQFSNSRTAITPAWTFVLVKKNKNGGSLSRSCAKTVDDPTAAVSNWVMHEKTKTKIVILASATQSTQVFDKSSQRKISGKVKREEKNLVGCLEIKNSYWEELAIASVQSPANGDQNNNGEEKEKKKIVIVGSGWAGLGAAHHLCKQELN